MRIGNFLDLLAQSVRPLLAFLEPILPFLGLALPELGILPGSSYWVNATAWGCGLGMGAKKASMR